MPDRYDDGILALQRVEVPDQWDDIEERAREGLIVPLDEDRWDRRRAWPMLLATAAALLAVVGVAAVLLRSGDDVATNPSDPGLTPPIHGPSSSSTARAPSTTEAPSGGFVACPRTLGLTTATAPTGWAATMQPAEEALPPSPAGVEQAFAGLFTGPTTADSVYVIAGLAGQQDDALIPFRGPVPGRNAHIAPFPGGWYMELAIPRPAADCWITIEAIGMTQQQAISFAQGLQGS